MDVCWFGPVTGVSSLVGVSVLVVGTGEASSLQLGGSPSSRTRRRDARSALAIERERAGEDEPE